MIILALDRLIAVRTRSASSRLFGILFFLISVTMVGIGLDREYVGRTYQVVRTRQRYFVREVIEQAQ